MNNSSTSPFRSTLTGYRRPDDLHDDTSMNLVVRSLEKENNTLAEEVALLRNKNKKVAELQDKIELVLKHNTQLLNENEKLAKLINQKKSQVEIWKSKFESHSAAKSSSQDLQIKRLLNQIEKLKEDVCEVEHAKSIQLNEIKNQHHSELQHIKRANLNSCEMYELEIRKLKELIDKKDYEYGDLNAKMARFNKEMEFQMNKLKEERERLKSDLLHEDNEHKREVEAIKAKLDFNFHAEIENLKKQHYNEVESLDYQNSKLKDVISSKNQEIQQILNKNLKVKQNYEESLLILKRQNEALKDKISDNQRIFELQMTNLRQKLEGRRESQVGLMKNAHANQVEILQHEIAKLEAMVNTKNIQLENLIKEKNQIRLSLETEIAKLKSELDVKNSILKENAVQYQKDLDALETTIHNKDEEIKNIENLLNRQISNLQSEVDALKPVLARKAEDLERLERTSSKEIRDLAARNQELSLRYSELKDDHERSKTKSSTEIDEQRKLYDVKLKQLEERIKSLDEQNVQKDKTIATLKGSLELKERELQTLKKSVSNLEGTQKRLKKELEESKNRNINKETEYNRIIKEQRERMETNFNFELQNNRNDSKNIIAGLHVQIKDLRKQIEAKNQLIDDLRRKYDELSKKFQELFAQQANRKALDIKQPGWIPETIATKGLFDVFIKNKVLDYCQ